VLKFLCTVIFLRSFFLFLFCSIASPPLTLTHHLCCFKFFVYTPASSPPSLSSLSQDFDRHRENTFPLLSHRSCEADETLFGRLFFSQKKSNPTPASDQEQEDLLYKLEREHQVRRRLHPHLFFSRTFIACMRVQAALFISTFAIRHGQECAQSQKVNLMHKEMLIRSERAINPVSLIHEVFESALLCHQFRIMLSDCLCPTASDLFQFLTRRE
jgi:hypothetical protein